MSYYSDRREAINLIDSLIEEGSGADKIYFVVSKRFGFGIKLVKERVDLYERLQNGENNDKNE